MPTHKNQPLKTSAEKGEEDAPRLSAGLEIWRICPESMLPTSTNNSSSSHLKSVELCLLACAC